MWQIIKEIIAVSANVFSIGAAAVALYLFFFKGKQIASFFQLLLRYSFHITITELFSKLDRINNFSAADEEGGIEVVNILSEIEGQINGNPLLRKNCKTISKKVYDAIRSKKPITETSKRSLVSELRETIKNIHVSDYHEFARRSQ